MSMNKTEDLDLDLFFDAARKDSLQPDSSLMARVLADADALQPEAPGLPVAARATVRPVSALRQFLSAIGGWSGMVGLTTATMAGLWIGISPPTSLQSVSSYWQTTTEDSYIQQLDSYSMLMLEEGN